MGWNFSIICPCWPDLRGFWCLTFLPTPSTSTMFFLGNVRITLPDLPLSTPEITVTVSPFLIWRVFIQFQLHDLRRARDYGLVAQLLEIARDGAEDAAGLRLFFVLAAGLQNHHRIFIKANIRAVLAAEGFALAHHYRRQDVFLFDRLARLGGLHRQHHQLAYLGVALFGRAGYFENASDFSAGVVCNLYE